jgi:hypothetical protein
VIVLLTNARESIACWLIFLPRGKGGYILLKPFYNVCLSLWLIYDGRVESHVIVAMFVVSPRIAANVQDLPPTERI